MELSFQKSTKPFAGNWIFSATIFILVANSRAVKHSSGRIFETLMVPGATMTEATSIYHSEFGGPLYIAGYYGDRRGTHGFLDVNGKITTIDVPGSSSTRAYGIASDGVHIVGSYTDSKHVSHGFVREAAGSFGTIDFPGAAWTQALGISSDGKLIAGSYADLNGMIHGFINGMTIDVPDSHLTEIHGVVTQNHYFAGSYVDSSGVEHGAFGVEFQFNSNLDFPGAKLTSANGINDTDMDVVGYYGTKAKGPFHGFFYGANFESIDFPGGIDTRCNGIADTPFAGTEFEIVGRYTDTKGVVRGFYSKPSQE